MSRIFALLEEADPNAHWRDWTLRRSTPGPALKNYASAGVIFLSAAVVALQGGI